MNWCDERLITGTDLSRYDYDKQTLYNLLEGNSYHIDRIWKPSIFVPNNEEPITIDKDSPISNALRVDLKTGRVWLRKRSVLT